MSAPLDATLRAFGLLLAGDPALWRLVGASLLTGLAGLLLAAPPAILLGYLLATHAGPWRRVWTVLAQLALLLPPLFVGLLLYLLLAPGRLLGKLEWLFTQPAMVLGQCLVALPAVLVFTLVAVQAVDPCYGETARALGASRRQVMLRVLHEARFGVLAAVLLGFGRAIGEMGCALVLGGNLIGRRTLASASAVAAAEGDVARAIALGIVLLAIALPCAALLLALQGGARAPRGAQ
jgi:tungstate transport system permease protein